MARPRKVTPRYLSHKQSGRARAVWTDATGQVHDVLLPGHYGSSESKKAFGLLVLEQEATPAVVAAARGRPNGPSLAEVLLAYVEHATQHYKKPDGTTSSELTEVKLVCRSLREHFAALPAADFSPLKLKAVRQAWLNAGLSRSEINRRTRLTKRLFRWAAAEELVPAATYAAVALVSGLQKGRTPARETEPVGPVAGATVDATLPHLGRHPRALVELLRLTGMRPGEACSIRSCDIDTSGEVWVYRPATHKTAWRGKNRAVAIGPRAQQLLKPFLTGDPDAYLFSPAAAVDEHRAARAAGRKTPRYRSHMARNKSKRVKHPKRGAADHYTTSSLGQAIDRACDRAFWPPAPLAKQPGETAAERKARLTPDQWDELKAWVRSRRWDPNQLRHTHGTEVRRRFGLEAAQAALGHERADVTQVYAEKNLELATKVAAEIG